MLPFTIDELKAAVANGDVTARPHSTLPYTIYNYSPEVQFSKKWNEVTLNCRGLILDADYNIVARPWKKFFNLGEVNLPMQFTDPVEVMDKADGSLGILYPVGQMGYEIATRGSFQSEQAQRATEILHRNYRQDFLNLDAVTGFYTLLFEIIYPSNRIVLDYGDMEDLILLGAVGIDTGYYIGPREAQAISGWTGPVVEVFDYANISEALGHMDRKNAEGYVIRSHNFMVKLKQPDYLELHRLVTNASPRTVWEQLRAGKSESEIVSAFPDEFHDYVKGMTGPLLEAFDSLATRVTDEYFICAGAVQQKTGLTPSDPSFRKAFALSVKGHKWQKFFFALLDERDIRDVLWSELKPTAD